MAWNSADLNKYLNGESYQQKITNVNTLNSYYSNGTFVNGQPTLYNIDGTAIDIYGTNIGYPFSFDVKVTKSKNGVVQYKILVLDNPATEIYPIPPNASTTPIALYDADFILTTDDNNLGKNLSARIFDDLKSIKHGPYDFNYTADSTPLMTASFALFPGDFNPQGTTADLSYTYGGTAGNVAVSVLVNLDTLRNLPDGFDISFYDGLKTGKAQLKISSNLFTKSTTYKLITGPSIFTTYYETNVLLNGIEVMTITVNQIALPV
jgi:hypothetical protein